MSKHTVTNQGAISRKNHMFTFNTITNEQKAKQDRLPDVLRLVREAGASLTDWLRQRHEGALRRLPRPERMRSVNATPV